ncbi:CapA family protein [Gramella sp. GC03-9]|uniref:CapA family protein n=1 Tax=Christiangramia oceanisediminis TaxID=2920386 RepID=A0A9X2RE01_9FLAO|nr:CapA family protein [Gramella oceanisediminis]MCP9201595.1 CapA family protein [Gramella oceanisediminis]
MKKPDANTSIRLFLAGDVMTGRGIDQALPVSVSPELYEAYVKDARSYLQLAERKSGKIDTPVDHKYIWGDAIQVWREYKPNLKLINLETSITTSSEAWPGKGIHYRMHPENVELFKVAGIDHVSLANNHILDWSRKGLQESIESLEKAGISFSGVGKDHAAAQAPSTFHINNTRILVFSYGAWNSGIPSSWKAEVNISGVNYLDAFGKTEFEKVKENIQSFKEPDDLVIFSIHWGGNWGYDIPQEHIDFAHRLIDEAGVDIIFGHSSHHPLGMEVYHDRLIIYGAGDFINDYEGISGNEKFKPQLSLMYFPVVDSEGQLKALTMQPMHIKKLQLNKADKKQAKWLEEVLSGEGQKFGTSLKLNENNELFLSW